MRDIAMQLLSSAHGAMADGDYERAFYFCNQAIEQDPELPDAHTALLDCLIGAANDAMIHDDFERAIGFCNQAIERDDKIADAWSIRAYARGASGEMEPALQDLSRAIELNPSDVHAREYRAIALGETGRVGEAEQEFRRLTELEPEYSGGWTGLGKILLDELRPREALPMLRKALRHDPQDSIALALLANTALQLGEFETALANVARTREAGYDGAELLLTEGDAFYGLRRYADAAQAFRACRDAGAADDYCMVMLARALLAQCKWAEALESLLAVSAEESDTGGWHAIHAEALLHAGRHAEAVPELERALDTFARVHSETMTPYSEYNLAWAHAHRAALAERFNLAGISVEAERSRVRVHLAEAIKNESSILNFARATAVFDQFRDEPFMQADASSVQSEPAT